MKPVSYKDDNGIRTFMVRPSDYKDKAEARKAVTLAIKEYREDPTSPDGFTFIVDDPIQGQHEDIISALEN